MGDPTDNTNKIDNYGVWVKRGPGENAEESPQINFDDEMKLPNLSENTLGDGDMFITPPPESPANTQTIEAAQGPKDDALPKIDGIEGFDFSAFDVSGDSIAPKDSIADIPDGEVSFDDLLGGDSSDGEISLDDFMSGGTDEISLDDFLDDFGGGSKQKEDDVPDDTPLDIDVKFNEDPKNQVPTEDIPLEDMSDDNEEIAEAGESSVEKAAIDEVSDENEAADRTQQVQASPVVMETVDFGLEEVSLDDFNLDESDDATAAALGASINSAAATDDGLAMFGKPKVVDYDLAITEDDVTQAAPNVEETESPKGQEQNTNTTTVDNSLLEQIVSDLAGLKNEITSIKADLVNLKEGKVAIPSVKSDDTESLEMEIQTSEIEPSVPDMPEIGEIDNTQNTPEMSDTIADDGDFDSPFFGEAPTEKPVESQEGFFSDSDDDENIALSGNELDNIVNTSEITEEEDVEAETAEEGISLAERENEFEVNSEQDIPSENTEAVFNENQGGFFSDDNDETISLSGNELENIVSTSEITDEENASPEEIETPAKKAEDSFAFSGEALATPEGTPLEEAPSEEMAAPSAIEEISEEAVESELEPIEERGETPAVVEDENDFSTDFSEISPFGTISDEDMALESTDAPDTGLSMTIDNDALEEPNLDEIEQNVENTEDISLPKPEEIPMADEDKIIPPDESAIIAEEPVLDEPVVGEPTIDEPSAEESFIEPIADESAIEEPAIDKATLNEPVIDNSSLEKPVVSETTIDEPSAEESFAEPIADELAIEEPEIDEATLNEPVVDDSTLEEPAVGEQTIDEPSAEESFIEPIADEPAIEEPKIDEATIDEPVVDDSTLEEPVVSEPTIDEPSTEESFIEPIADEPAIEEPEIDEATLNVPVVDNSALEEPVVGESPLDEPTIDEPVVEETHSPIDYEKAKQIQDGYMTDIMNEDDSVSETLSDESVNYLNEDKNVLNAEICAAEHAQAASPSPDLPSNLKSDVKSVLLYMDQLLENLPEEKIVEFAKSDHFATYKKLFKDLGLA